MWVIFDVEAIVKLIIRQWNGQMDRQKQMPNGRKMQLMSKLEFFDENNDILVTLVIKQLLYETLTLIRFIEKYLIEIHSF